MSALWWWLLAGAAACYLLKLSGYLVPQRLLDSPMLVKISSSLTIGLLASLVMAKPSAVLRWMRPGRGIEARH